MLLSPDLKKYCFICEDSALYYKFSVMDYITGENFCLYQCPNCKLAITSPFISDTEINKYYEDIYYGKRKSIFYQLINRRWVNTATKYLNHTSSKACSLLDIGCGDGSFILTLKNKGWKIRGTEIAPKDHLNPVVLSFICQKSVENCGYPRNEFDLITMWHSLEHISNPLICIKASFELLKNGGYLLIEIPNIESWQAILTKGDWFHLEVPRHYSHFSPKSIRMLLQKNGYSNVKISFGSPEYSVFGYMQSILNKMTKSKNLFFNTMNGKISIHGIKNNISALLITALAVLPIALFSIVFYYLEILFKSGGIMIISAQKYEKN